MFSHQLTHVLIFGAPLLAILVAAVAFRYREPDECDTAEHSERPKAGSRDELGLRRIRGPGRDLVPSRVAPLGKR